MGTEIAASLVSKNNGALKVADVILILNVVIFQQLLFFRNSARLFSILTYFAASKTIDFLLHGLENILVLLSFLNEAKISALP